MSVDSIAAPTLPLQTIIPSYAYQQYVDDPYVVAFFTTYNQLAQTYLDWSNTTPLGVYTSPHVTGPLLDWIGQGVYGIPRPIFSTLAAEYLGNALNTFPLDAIAIDGSTFSESGSAFAANDDFYKRVITWMIYLGDGRYFNLMTLRKRIARFLYGVNGTDISLSQTQNVSINFSSPVELAITIPAAANPASSYFQEALAAGVLSFPFMLGATVSIV